MGRFFYRNFVGGLGVKQSAHESNLVKSVVKRATWAENPLYQIFTTYYNRIYGRIRRGSLDNDTTLLNDIKLLHQEFSSKYDTSNDSESKEKNIDSFIIEADKLLS